LALAGGLCRGSYGGRERIGQWVGFLRWATQRDAGRPSTSRVTTFPNERVPAGPGTAVHLPRGLQHGFAVHSEIARVILLVTPGGLEQGFAKLAVPTELELPPTATGPPSSEEAEALSEAFADRGVTFVGPPLPVLLAHGAN
jgi:hypothetical protein